MSAEKPPFLPAAVLDAFRASGAARVRCRLEWLLQVMDPMGLPYHPRRLQPGARLARLDCPACIEIWIAGDGEITADWEAF